MTRADRIQSSSRAGSRGNAFQIVARRCDNGRGPDQLEHGGQKYAKHRNIICPPHKAGMRPAEPALRSSRGYAIDLSRCGTYPKGAMISSFASPVTAALLRVLGKGGTAAMRRIPQRFHEICAPSALSTGRGLAEDRASHAASRPSSRDVRHQLFPPPSVLYWEIKRRRRPSSSPPKRTRDGATTGIRASASALPARASRSWLQAVNATDYRRQSWANLATSPQMRRSSGQGKCPRHHLPRWQSARRASPRSRPARRHPPRPYRRARVDNPQRSIVPRAPNSPPRLHD